MAVDYVGIATVLAASTSLVTAAAGAYARVKFGGKRSSGDDGGQGDELEQLRAQIDELAKRSRHQGRDHPGRAERVSLPFWRLTL